MTSRMDRDLRDIAEGLATELDSLHRTVRRKGYDDPRPPVLARYEEWKRLHLRRLEADHERI